MSRYKNFCGPSYVSLAAAANSERTVNLFPEVIEAATPKNKMALIGTPGDTVFVDLGIGPVRGMAAQDGRMFAVGGGSLFEVYADGTATNRGAVGIAVDPAVLVTNGQQGHQWLVISNGNGFIFDLVTNTLVQIPAAGFPAGVRSAVFVDGYFIVLIPGTSLFGLSGLLKGLEWDTLDRAARSTASDNLITVIADHREAWFFGSETMEVWIDSGNASFPFQPLRGTVMQVGMVGHGWSLATLRDEQAKCWLGKTDGGPRVFATLIGYTPEPISTHAVDLAIQGYGEEAQNAARGYAYQEHGHTFYVLTFPTVGLAWVYDLTESKKAQMPLWHERTRWNVTQGVDEAPTGWNHCYAFGKHLVGSRDDGKIYSQSLTTYTHNGAMIRRVRRAPYINAEHRRLFFSRFELVGEWGVGLQTGQGSAPTALLRWSDTGWKTASDFRSASLGPVGEYDTQPTWDQLGSTPGDRGFEVVITDPIGIRLTDAYVDVEVGTH